LPQEVPSVSRTCDRFTGKYYSKTSAETYKEDWILENEWKGEEK